MPDHKRLSRRGLACNYSLATARGGGGDASSDRPVVLPGSRAPESSSEITIEHKEFASGGLILASAYTGPIRDPASLEALRGALDARHRALPELQALRERLQQSPGRQLSDEMELLYRVATSLLFEGLYAESSAAFERLQVMGRLSGVSRDRQQYLRAIQGIICTAAR
jgi:hypothetical protein